FSISYVLFVRIPRAPRPTLFPYTTLFRSGSQNIVGQDFLRLLVHALGSIVGARNHRNKVKPGNGDDLIASIPGHEKCWIALLAGDRKSTRLNSSHLGISYAVFCLKKKKNK